MDIQTRAELKQAVAFMKQLLEAAASRPNMPDVWLTAARTAITGGLNAVQKLEQGESYGTDFVFTSTGGPHHELLTTSLEPVPLFPKRDLTDIPDVIAQGIDGGFLPDTNTEGIAKVQVMEGFTVVAFADRSADRRAGSHSTFVLSGVYPAETGIARAQELFPDIWSRYTFNVVLQV